MASVLMTGATGAVGGAVRDELASRSHRVTTVGRGGDVQWDLREPLPPAVVEAAASADVMVHCAADIRLGEPYEKLYRVNVGALENLVAALRALPAPPRLVHVSSAFAEARDGRDHNNGYERSKLAAETVVLGSGLPACILRPSLVIGSRRDGGIGRFSGIYIFIRMLRLGLIPAIPGFSGVGVDLIPVDVVAREAAAEIEAPSGRSIVSVTSGAAAPSLEQLVTVACDTFDAQGGARVDRPKFVTPDVYHRLFRPLVMSKLSPAQRVMLETVEIFLPYFERDHVFESTLDLTSEELIETWAKSVERWLEETGDASPRGRAVWAKRS